MLSIYRDSAHCMQVLHGTEAIDFFVATNLYSKCTTASNLPATQTSQLFHLFIALSYFQRLGHSCVNVALLAEQRLWFTERDALGFKFASMQDIQALLDCIQQAEPLVGSVQVQGDLLYTQRYFAYEQEIADYYLQQRSKQVAPVSAELLSLWPALFPVNTEIDSQQLAVASALLQHTPIVCGGAGTGKTYTVTRIALTHIIEAKARQQSMQILFAAPTGKAAQRLHESLKNELAALSSTSVLQAAIDALSGMIQASTLHRVLGLGGKSGQAKYHQAKPLVCDLFVIDEASMLDMALLCKVLRALPSSCKLLLVGDNNQLPSVETGNVLADLVDAQTAATAQHAYSQQHWQSLKSILPQLPEASTYATNTSFDHVSRLQGVKRSNQSIVAFADYILTQGKDEQLVIDTEQDTVCFVDDSYTEKGELSQRCVKQIADYYAPIFTAPDLAHAFEQLAQYRCLSPTRLGATGTTAINQQVLAHFAQQGLLNAGHEWSSGVPIMIVQNDYRLGLFNGDIGLLWKDEAGQIKAFFESSIKGQYKSYSKVSLPAFEVVYAMTIHKTQGSEFSHVDIVLAPKQSEFLNRELLYTGVTRAKQKVNILGSSAQFKAAIALSNQRMSGLRDKLM